MNDLLTVWRAERRLGEDTAFSEAVARGLHKLTAYKDEYEVARLLTDPAFEARLAAEVPGGTGLRYRLHPPDAQGARQAAARSRSARGCGPCCRPWRAGRRCAAPRSTRSAALRSGSWSALCGTSTARWCCGWPRSSRPDSYATAVAAAEAADLVRGYEDVKLAGVRRYRAAASRRAGVLRAA